MLLGAVQLAAPVAAQTLPPVLRLNHVYMVIDSATYHDLTVSPFLHGEFGGYALHDSAAPGEPAGVYLYGHHTYLIFVPPGGFPGAEPGDIGIALSTDTPGGLLQLARHLAFDSLPFDTATVTLRDSTGSVPWYQELRPAGPDRSGPHDALWAMEYTLAMTRRVAARDSFGTEDRDRDRFIASHYDSLQLFGDVSRATLAIPVDELARMRQTLAAWGIKVYPEGAGAVVELPAMTLRLVPAYAGAGVQNLTFTLNHDAAANPTYRFGLRTHLEFGPGPTAVWEFAPR